jgi:hypothetical protein
MTMRKHVPYITPLVQVTHKWIACPWTYKLVHPNVLSVTYTLLGKKVFITEKDFVHSEVWAAAEETVQQ